MVLPLPAEMLLGFAVLYAATGLGFSLWLTFQASKVTLGMLLRAIFLESWTYPAMLLLYAVLHGLFEFRRRVIQPLLDITIYESE